MTKTTHGGGDASAISLKEQLSRTVMSCLLWENNFYEDGVSVSDRIANLSNKVPIDDLIAIIHDAKFKSKLRHVPLFMLITLISRGGATKEFIQEIITRPDDVTELLSLYWKDGKKPLSKQMVKGINLAFEKFDEYQFAKYKGNSSKSIVLRDVMKLTRPKPSAEREELYGRVINNTLATPDTWEVAISAAGSDNSKKKEEFERLLSLDKGGLGDLAFLRNLRKMGEVGVSSTLIKQSFGKRKWGWIIPYQFFTAMDNAPKYESELEAALFKSIANIDKRTEKVGLLVDVSGSMDSGLSYGSSVNRTDVAASLAVLIKEVFPCSELFTFNNSASEVNSFKGFSLKKEIKRRVNGGTSMWKSIKQIAEGNERDLVIVITDEQTSDSGTYKDANAKLLVIINVANYKNGVSYDENTLHINGWSDNTVAYLCEYLDSYL